MRGSESDAARTAQAPHPKYPPNQLPTGVPAGPDRRALTCGREDGMSAAGRAWPQPAGPAAGVGPVATAGARSLGEAAQQLEAVRPSGYLLSAAVIGHARPCAVRATRPILSDGFRRARVRRFSDVCGTRTYMFEEGDRAGEGARSPRGQAGLEDDVGSVKQQSHLAVQSTRQGGRAAHSQSRQPPWQYHHRRDYASTPLISEQLSTESMRLWAPRTGEVNTSLPARPHSHCSVGSRGVRSDSEDGGGTWQGAATLRAVPPLPPAARTSSAAWSEYGAEVCAINSSAHAGLMYALGRQDDHDHDHNRDHEQRGQERPRAPTPSQGRTLSPHRPQIRQLSSADALIAVRPLAPTPRKMMMADREGAAQLMPASAEPSADFGLEREPSFSGLSEDARTI